MSDSIAASSPQRNRELEALYDGSADGILAAEIRTRRFVRANGAMCRFLGYGEKELLTLSVSDIHPPENVLHVLDLFTAMSQHRLKWARDVPCLRKDGVVVYADIAAACVDFQGKPCVLGFFHDVTEQKRAMEALRAAKSATG